MGKDGGIVTVTVEVTDDEATLSSEPLLSPAAGVVEELVVVRGTPLVQIGDSVSEGAEVVKNEIFFGEGDCDCPRRRGGSVRKGIRGYGRECAFERGA